MNLNSQKILFFTRTMSLGGTENVVLQLCEIFQPIVKKIVVCSCGGVNTNKLKNMGIKHYSIPDIENKNADTIIKVSRMLKKIITSENITLIHTHHRMAAFYVSFFKLYKKCCFVNTSHNTFMDKKWLTRYAYKNAFMVACGEMVKKNLVDFYKMPSSEIEVICNAVKPFDGNIVKDTLIKELHNQGFFVVGNVGRLSEQKGMEYYIQAIPLVLKRHRNVRFLIIGEGEDREKLEVLARDIGVEDKVFFMGFRTDIQNLMSQIDLVVLSSLREGLPLVPIEAFSVGRTIVATAVDGTVELVEDKYNGLLVEKKDFYELAEKICWMISNKQKMKEMETRAHLLYINKYSYEQFALKYKSFIKRIIK